MGGHDAGHEPGQQPVKEYCSEILERVFFFIDNELSTADSQQIRAHLEDCGPCLAKYDLERTVKSLVQRSCAERAPAGLRERVLLSIREVQVEIAETPGDAFPGR